MKIILYRHAEPIVSVQEVIKGSAFILWVQRYNESGIKKGFSEKQHSEFVYSSTLPRSIETAETLGRNIVKEPMLREAEVPLITFPPLKLKANTWTAIARLLWLCGCAKDCESYKDTKKRVRLIVDKLEKLGKKQDEITIVGHGCINFFLRRECRKRGWRIKRDTAQQDSYLSRTILYKPTTSTTGLAEAHR